jgi:hypothetical protein
MLAVPSAHPAKTQRPTREAATLLTSVSRTDGVLTSLLPTLAERHAMAVRPSADQTPTRRPGKPTSAIRSSGENATERMTLHGNHFLERDRDAEGGLWLLVHSGSRGLGGAIAYHHARRTAWWYSRWYSIPREWYFNAKSRTKHPLQPASFSGFLCRRDTFRTYDPYRVKVAAWRFWAFRAVSTQ